ncbi:MAG: DUF3303 family protein [Thermoplasmata archaeon]
MRFVATLTHPPEQCFARKEFLEEYKTWLGTMPGVAKDLGVRVEGAFVSPNEHTFYFVLEADSANAVAEFLGPPMLTHNRGQVSPVLDLIETWDLAAAFEETGD